MPTNATYSGDWSIRLTHTVSTTDAMFASLALPDADVTFADADRPGVALTTAAVSVTEGGAAEFGVTLTAKPLRNVTVSFAVTGPEDFVEE